MSNETTPAKSSAAEAPASVGPVRGNAFSAVRWVMAGSVAQRFVGLVAVGIIARVISEEHYGIYRELLGMHAVLFVLLPLGFDQLLSREIYRRTAVEGGLRGALLISSVAIALLLLLGAPLLAPMLGIPPEFRWLLYLGTAAVLLQAAKLRYKSPLVASLSFRQVSTGEVLNVVVASLLSLALLIQWRSPGALYCGFIAGEVAELLWLMQGRPRRAGAVRDDLSALAHLAGENRKFSLLYCVDQVVNTLGANAPLFILGGMLGAATAAGYGLASLLITMPLTLLVGALAKVALPALAGRSEEELHHRALELVSGAAAIIAPVLIAIAVLADHVVSIALGTRWTDSTAPIVRWLSIYCIFVGVFSPVSAVDILRNRMDVGLAWNAATLLLRVAALWWGSGMGVVAAVAAYSVVSCAMWLMNGQLIAWLLGAGYWRFHRAWLRFVPVWVLVGGVVWASTRIGDNSYLVLLLAAAAAACYPIILRVAAPDTYRLVRRLLKVPSRGAAPAVPVGERTGNTPDDGVPVP